MSTSEIRTILFLKAKEFKTTDELLLNDINTEIELTKNIVPSSLGDNYNLGVALLTAHNMKTQLNTLNGVSGSVASEEVDDRKITYSQYNKASSNPLLLTSYGEQYQQLLDLISDPDKKPKFWGFVV